jgi:predicted O-methyltransferase YrrM
MIHAPIRGVKDAKPQGRPAHPLPAFVAQAAREYRDKIAERILRRELRKPWMKYRETAVLEDLLRALRPMRVLEWGAGYGTSHFAGLLPEAGRWVAVEHDPLWASRLRESIADPRVHVRAVLPEAADWRERHEDGAYEDFRSYVHAGDDGSPYDFILVDGRAREACLERACGMLAPQGVVVLHDANRSFRRTMGERFPSQVEFRDYRRWSGGLWIGSKGRPLSTLLDLPRHGRIWRFYNSLGKRFHL